MKPNEHHLENFKLKQLLAHLYHFAIIIIIQIPFYFLFPKTNSYYHERALHP
jgi:hypothetical protein